MKKSLILIFLLSFVILINACGEGAIADAVKLDSQPQPTIQSVKSSLGIEDISYVNNDTYNGNPQAWLGTVYYIGKKGNESCSATVKKIENMDEYGLQVRNFDQIITTTPVKRESVIVTQSVAAGISLLSYLSTTFSGESVYTLMVFDQATGQVKANDAKWDTALNGFVSRNINLFTDNNICYVFVVKGFVQKNIVRKKFISEKTAASGGAFGMKIDASNYYSSNDYSVDIRYGLRFAVLKSPSTSKKINKSSFRVVEREMTKEEANIFKNINSIKMKKRHK